MSAPKRRRWFSLSLRTLLIGITLVSVLFAWFLYHRRVKTAERDQLLKEYHSAISRGRFGGVGFGPAVQLEFRDTLFGWELPHPRYSLDYSGSTWAYKQVDDSAWLRPLATPELNRIYISSDAQPASWDDLTALARRTPEVYLGGRDERARELLPRLLSHRTRNLSIEIPIDDLSAAPNLRELVCNIYSAGELGAVLSKESLEKMCLDASVEHLGHVPSGPPSHIRCLDMTFRWPGVPELAFGEYPWVQRCTNLREVAVTAADPAFLAAIGRNLNGVETLQLSEFDVTSVDQLASWTRLRHLTFDVDVGANDHILSDRFFLALGQLPSDLVSLEFDGGLGGDDKISAEALSVLRRFTHLKRLRLDYCELTREHMSIIADLSELKELSLYMNPLDDDAIEPLKRLRRLRRINLDGTNVSDEQFPTIRGDWIERPLPYRLPIVGAL
jgi:hypothetical protein